MKPEKLAVLINIKWSTFFCQILFSETPYLDSGFLVLNKVLQSNELSQYIFFGDALSPLVV